MPFSRILFSQKNTHRPQNRNRGRQGPLSVRHETTDTQWHFSKIRFMLQWASAWTKIPTDNQLLLNEAAHAQNFSKIDKDALIAPAGGFCLLGVWH
jgi:hypothetical protein